MYTAIRDTGDSLNGGCCLGRAHTAPLSVMRNSGGHGERGDVAATAEAHRNLGGKARPFADEMKRTGKRMVLS